MNPRLDVRVAIREADEIFIRFPVLLCLPMVVLGLVSYAATLLPARHVFSLGLLALLTTILLNWFVGIVLSAMYLRARDGQDPSWWQAGDVIRYRGLASTTARLLLRYFGWILLLGTVLGVAPSYIRRSDMWVLVRDRWLVQRVRRGARDRASGSSWVCLLHGWFYIATCLCFRSLSFNMGPAMVLSIGVSLGLSKSGGQGFC